ncbi:MAG: hypothetical protein J5634_02860 [Bacilli bacterium]|nr:hypothetical protein [Bacilli bacterium]
MKKNEKWVEKYKMIDPNDQLKIAERIVAELKENEFLFDGEGYDNEKSEEIRKFFNEYIINTKDKVKLSAMHKTLERFANLSHKKREAFLNKVYSDLEKYIKKIDGDKNKKNKEKDIIDIEKQISSLQRKLKKKKNTN